MFSKEQIDSSMKVMAERRAAWMAAQSRNEDDLVIPEFLRRPRTEETKAASQRMAKEILGHTRVWAPMKPYVEPRRQKTPLYPDNAAYPVQVVTGNPVRNIAYYDDFNQFNEEHDFTGYPVVKLVTHEGMTIIQVRVTVFIPNDGSSAVPIPVRQNGSRVQIWKRAEELWAQAGSPKDKKTVMKLRLSWMNILEAEGVKRNTCSCEFGQWMKTKTEIV